MRDDEDHEDDDEDWDDDDDDGYIPCPHCGESMLEAADYCPSCDKWITSEDLPAKSHSWWIVAVVLIVAGMILLSAIGF
jgi:uncharacterized protein (DUF983 family)